jgi:adenylate cyclase 8
MKLWNMFTHYFFQVVGILSVTFLSKDNVPKSAIMILLLVVFLTMVTYHARLVEVTSRLDFLWKQQAEHELTDMMETRANNTQLLKNILPDHVVHHFLGEDRLTEVHD